VALTLALVGLARADPVAMRAPGVQGPHATVALSTRSLSAAMAGSPPAGLRLGVEVGLDGGAVELAAGVAGQRIVDGWWGVEGGVAAGVAALARARSAALTLTPWAGVGLLGPRAAGALRVVVPAAVGPTGVRLPVLGELATGFGPRWLRVGPRVAAGPVWTVGLDVSLSVEAGAMVSLGL
jgi:hypothetical protein